jgi:hypothetical protein
LKESIPWPQQWPEESQEGELIILKCLASGEHFSRMDQEQAVAINWILVK